MKNQTVVLSVSRQAASGCRAAFTLVELLVVIAIIGILTGLLVPAMQNMREMSRRSQCEHNLLNVSLGLSSYNDRFGYFPAGTIDSSSQIKSQRGGGYHHNWLIGLMPMMDAANVSAAVDSSVSVYDAKNQLARDLQIPVLHCPSATSTAANTTCYAGIVGSTEAAITEASDGVFRLNLPVRTSQIQDGLSHTVFVGEKISAVSEDLSWMSGTRSSLRNLGHNINAEMARIRGPGKPAKNLDPAYVGGVASDHLGGAYLLFGSGEIQFKSASTDQRLLSQIADRADGTIPEDWKADMPVTISADKLKEVAAAAKESKQKPKDAETKPENPEPKETDSKETESKEADSKETESL